MTHHAPARVLLSPCLRLLALRQPSAIAQDLLDVCATQTSFDMTQLTLRPDETPYSALTRLLWGSPSLNSLRLRFVLAQWATVSLGMPRATELIPKKTALEASSSSFTSASDHLQAQIQQVVLAILLQWLETMAKGRSMGEWGVFDGETYNLTYEQHLVALTLNPSLCFRRVSKTSMDRWRHIPVLLATLRLRSPALPAESRSTSVSKVWRLVSGDTSGVSRSLRLGRIEIDLLISSMLFDSAAHYNPRLPGLLDLSWGFAPSPQTRIASYTSGQIRQGS